jgi:hypothetical protein
MIDLVIMDGSYCCAPAGGAAAMAGSEGDSRTAVPAGHCGRAIARLKATVMKTAISARDTVLAGQNVVGEQPPVMPRRFSSLIQSAAQ